jgi:hypothetical protein
MQFLVFGYYELDKFEKLSPDAMAKVVEKCQAHDEALKATGKVSMIGSLTMPGDWRSVRPQASGKPVVTDGPFSEAKELVGSFFFVEAADIDEAVRIASLHPAGQMGAEMGWGLDVRGIDSCQMGRIASGQKQQGD